MENQKGKKRTGVSAESLTVQAKLTPQSADSTKSLPQNEALENIVRYKDKPPSGFMEVELEKNRVTYQGRTAKIIWKDDRILKDGLPADVGAYFADGNCLTPEVLNGDIIAITGQYSAINGSIVLIEHPDKGYWLQRYRENEGKRWVTSRHGDMSLDEWAIVGTVILIARYPNEIIVVNRKEYLKLPVIKLGPLPAIK